MLPRAVQPGNYGTGLTFFIWTILLLGGASTVLGPIIGSMIFWVLLSLTEGLLSAGVSSGVITFIQQDQIGGIRFMLVGLGLMMSAQSETELYQLGLKYKKEVDNVKMLQIFKKLYDIDAKNQEYLSNLSFAYSKVGSNLDDAELQLKYYAKAKSIASESKVIKDGHAFSHYAYALALARENENAKTKVKIANAKEIKILKKKRKGAIETEEQEKFILNYNRIK